LAALAKAARRFAIAIFAIGLGLALYNALVFRTSGSWTILALYLVMLAIELTTYLKVRVQGYVSNLQGQPLNQVVVQAYSVHGEEKRLVGATVSDAHGNYRLSLPAGNYVLSLSKSGFTTYVSEHISLKRGTPATIPAELEAFNYRAIN